MARAACYVLIFLFFTCHGKKERNMGSIERMNAALDSVIDPDARIEILAHGFQWTEGPLWIEKQQMLLFSDVFKNSVYKWTKAKGTELYLTPSGYTSTEKRGGEWGSNGLTLNNTGQLVLCQHGNREVALMNAPIERPKPVFITLANRYNAKRLNSPNDLVYDSKGNLYFTDPPYGLGKNMDDPSKELPFQGVYRLNAAGQISLLIDSITRPNGIALTPDESHLVISNSDSTKPGWYIYELGADGSLANGKLFYDASAARSQEPGNPDGLKIDKSNHVFASGPGGIWIFDKEAQVLGKIRFPEKISNCTFSKDEKVLYITATQYVLRIRLRK